MHLKIDVKNENGISFVIPKGEIDVATQGQLKEAVSELIVGGDVNLVIDLTEVEFIDSTGLGALISARRKAHAFKGSFAIVCTNPNMLRLFSITNLDKVFAIHDSREDVLTATV